MALARKGGRPGVPPSGALKGPGSRSLYTVFSSNTTSLDSYILPLDTSDPDGTQTFQQASLNPMKKPCMPFGESFSSLRPEALCMMTLQPNTRRCWMAALLPCSDCRGDCQPLAFLARRLYVCVATSMA